MLTHTFDPQSIADTALRHMVFDLMNQVETLHTRVQAQAEEIQRLRDENNRLKGEQAKPVIRPNTPTGNISSETERHEPTLRHKSAKIPRLTVSREEILKVDAQLLPDDAVFKGYQDVIVQDIVLTTTVIRFRKEKYYSPSQKKTYLAAVPTGYEGQFGPGVKALTLTLAYDTGVSIPKIRTLYAQAGLIVSTGYLVHLLTRRYPEFQSETAAIFTAGVGSSPWQHLDTTATRVNGVLQNCHVLCNPFYTIYMTTPHRDRLSTLDVLRGGQPRTFRMDVTAQHILTLMGFPPIWQRNHMASLPQNITFTEAEIDIYLQRALAEQNPTRRKWIKDALAVAAYHAQETIPVVRALVCDDAPQFALITEAIAACWVHDGRHYTKLAPKLTYHQQILSDFRAKYWAYYHRLRTYQKNPTLEDAQQLQSDFDTLFTTVTGYTVLDARIAMSLRKKPGLLTVLAHPEVPLTNNPAELAVRQRVRKRDVSLAPRSAVGATAWDTFQSVAATAQKVEVNFYAYLYDRICQQKRFPALSELVRERAQTANLGGLWAAQPPKRAWKPVPVQTWWR